MTFTEHPLPDLPEHKRCFVTDAGHHVLVTITRSENHSPEAESQHRAPHVGLKVHAQLVDAAGEPEIFGEDAIGGKITGQTAEVFVVDAAAIASGKLTIEGEIARATALKVEHAVNLRAAMKAWCGLHRLPVG